MEEAGGIGYDYIRVLAMNLEVKIEYAGDIPWPDVLSGIEKGSIDVIPAAARSAGREKILNFTEPIISSPMVIFSRNDASYIGNLAAGTYLYWRGFWTRAWPP